MKIITMSLSILAVQSLHGLNETSQETISQSTRAKSALAGTAKAVGSLVSGALPVYLGYKLAGHIRERRAAGQDILFSFKDKKDLTWLAICAALSCISYISGRSAYHSLVQAFKKSQPTEQVS